MNKPVIPAHLVAPKTEREHQSLFALLIGHLMVWSFDQGYDLTTGDFHDADGDGGHMKDGAHAHKMGADLNLYINGVWQTLTEAHQPIGSYWKTLHPLCRWGGDFKGVKPDGNHYSIEWKGKK